MDLSEPISELSSLKVAQEYHFNRGWHRTVAFRTLLDLAPFGCLITDATAPDNPIVAANRRFFEITGYEPGEVIGRNCRFLQGPETDPLARAEVREAVEAGRSFRRAILNYRKDGSPFWNELTLSPVRNRAGRLINFIGIQLDVTEHQRALERAAEVQQMMFDLTENMPGFVFQRRMGQDGQMQFSFCSRSLLKLLGLDDMPETLDDFLAHVHPADAEQLRSSIARTRDTTTGGVMSYRLIGPSGETIWIRSSNTRRVLPSGEVVWDGCAVDVTQEKAAQERLAFLDTNDPLTGLPNRAGFEAKVRAAVSRLAPPQRLVLTSVQLDEIQEVRDVLGASAADALAQAVAERLTAGRGDGQVVARTSETRFDLLAVQRATRDGPPSNGLGRVLAAPFEPHGVELRLRPRIGIAWLDAQEARTLGPAAATQAFIKRSEIALIEGARDRRDSPVLYAPEMEARMALRVRLKRSLSQQVGYGEFELHYQPLVDLRSLDVVGAEALLRWRHPELGMQPPDLFIPLAEETGDILSLGSWVLRKATRQAKRWADEGRPLKLAVNVSPLQIRHPRFAEGVAALIEHRRLDPALLALELTESAVIEGSAEVGANLQALKAMGVSLAIDDFGAGYAGLRYLTTLPADTVKVDRSLVRNIGSTGNGAAMLGGVLELIRSLGLAPVCEGIETAEQLAYLQAQNVDFGQGYLFSRPLPAEEFEAFLTRWNERRSAA